MPRIELTLDEIIYLENTLRMVQDTGQPTRLREGENLAQQILDKLEAV